MLFELIADPDGLTEMVAERARDASDLHALAYTGLVIAPPNDLVDAARPSFAGDGTTNLGVSLRAVLSGLGLPSDLPVLADNDHESIDAAVGSLAEQQTILVFSWGAVTGLTLRRLKKTAADALLCSGRRRDVHGLVFHSRTSAPDEWSAAKNQFRPGNLLNLWSSCYPWDSPMIEEHRLLYAGRA